MIFLPIRVYYIMRKKWIARLSGIVINWRGSHPFLVSCFFFFIFYISFLLSSSPAYYPFVGAQPLIFFHGYVHFSECTELTVWIIKLAWMEATKGKYGRLRRLWEWTGADSFFSLLRNWPKSTNTQSTKNNQAKNNEWKRDFYLLLQLWSWITFKRLTPISILYRMNIMVPCIYINGSSIISPMDVWERETN